MNDVVYSRNLPTAAALQRLFRQTTWANNRTIEETERIICGLTVFTCVWLEGELIGFGRAISDGIFRAMIDDVIVDENHRGRGIGAMIMSDLLQQLGGVDEIFLNTKVKLHGFYRSKGFEKFEGHTMRKRKILSESV